MKNKNTSLAYDKLNSSASDSTIITNNDQGFWWTVKKIMNPPIYAALISIPLALIPYMQEYVFSGSGAVLTDNFFDALTTMGSCVSPMINIILGHNLSQGYPPTADISK